MNCHAIQHTIQTYQLDVVASLTSLIINTVFQAATITYQTKITHLTFFKIPEYNKMYSPSLLF